MKINQPVTQREKPFPAGCYLVSKTNLKGAITYVNDAFEQISGFTREELIGANHNIVRHPDMPPQAFEDLWRTVKSGTPWRGMVKNRCKDGDHYWVEAFVVPIYEKDKTIGYTSVRSRPSRQDIAEAEARYKQLNSGHAKLDSRPPAWRRISLRARLLGVMFFIAAMMLVLSVLGLRGIVDTNRDLEKTYHARMVPTEKIGRIATLMSENSRQVMLAIQHNPSNPFVHLHDHAVTVHTGAIEKNRDEITELAKGLAEIEGDERFHVLFTQYTDARNRYVKEGLMAAMAAVAEGHFDQANLILLQKVNPTYQEAADLARQLQDALNKAALDEFKASEHRYTQIRMLSIGGIVFALLLVALATWNLLGSIIRPLSQVIRHFERMSQGILTDPIDITGRDEAGRVLTQLAAMQVQLKVMLDEVRGATDQIDQHSTWVDTQVRSVVDQSEEQRDHAASVAVATSQFSQTVKQVAEDATLAAGAADDAQAQTVTAQASMSRSSDATAQVVKAVQASSDTISNLNTSVSKIGNISQVIKEIADQTNLLALNAAIEAARAGEAGRGFAVVADEVRKLAERTSSSTKEITTTVAEIREVANSAVASMNHAVKEVEQGIGMIRESVEGLSNITETSQDVANRSRQNATAANEQAITSEEMAANMQQIVALIDENMKASREAKSAADALKQTAGGLRTVVGKFKVLD